MIRENEMKQESLKQEWEKSYKRKDNFVFYPHEEIIRFAAKYIVKKVGLTEFNYFNQIPQEIKVLDLGCGIGRHVIFFEKMGIEAFGIDLSSEAIKIAKEWANMENINHFHDKLVEGNISSLPWKDKTFNFMVSHGVLDSMPFKIAKKAIQESQRVLKEDGLFYCDLVSGDDFYHSREYCGEEIVKTDHEKNTVQSYFNFSKIKELIDGFFSIEECKLIKQENCISGGFHSRYHLILKKEEIKNMTFSV